jgi:hypothetical protein
MAELLLKPFQFTVLVGLVSFKGFSEPVTKKRFAKLGR